MSLLLYPIDKTSLLNLQRLYDAFIYDHQSNSYLKSLSRDFWTLQRSPYRRKVYRLYDDLFHATKPEELQMIVRETNKLMSKLLTKYGNFTLDSGFTKVDPLDEILLYDLIDSFSTQNTPH
jgi:hypothetical protein